MFRVRSPIIATRKDVLLRISGLRKSSGNSQPIPPKSTVEAPVNTNQAARGMKRTRRFLWRLVGVTMLGYAGVGAVVGASWYSKGFRELFERNVPYSAELIAAALYTYLPPPPYERKELTFRDVLLHDEAKQETADSINNSMDNSTQKTEAVVVTQDNQPQDDAPAPAAPSQSPLVTEYMKQQQEEEQLTKQKQRDAALAEFYDRLAKARDLFTKEIDSIVLGKEKPSEDQLNALIAHAHRRIEQLERQLANHQAVEQRSLAAAIDQQRLEHARLRDERVDLEKHSLRDLLSTEKAKWELEARVEFERDLRRELSRQSAAHTDHLSSVLNQQERQQDMRYKMELHFVLLSQTDAFRSYLAHSVAKLRAIDTALADREEQEKRSLKARQLWVACQALMAAVVNGNGDQSVSLRPLASEAEAVIQAADKHPFVTNVISALPAEALQHGVYTEETLVNRFTTVQRVCRRVAMIDERGGSLPSYLLSYIQSLFVFRRKAFANADSEDYCVDVGALTTFEIVDEAQNALRAGRLDLAVRLVNQLKGQPRRVASDWLNDARILLEARQASCALLAYSAATGAGASY